MKKYIIGSLALIVFLICLLPFNNLHALGVTAPTLLKIENGRVLGLAHINSEVMIYVDGSYVANADMGKSNTETNNFVYVLSEKISVGHHVLEALAKDKTSLLLSIFSNPINFYIKDLSAPTMIEPDENTITGKVKPFVTGLTVNNTKVHFFVDGVYNGKTEFLNHESGTANFAYRPFLNLEPGAHNVWTIAEDVNGRKSSPSNVLYFNIEKQLPSPTIFKPVVNQHTNIEQPFIVGLAKNYSKIKVFIDHKLDGEFMVENHPSGTANFAYRPFSFLTSGNHLVYTSAVDSRGKESRWSNVVYFFVPGPIVLASEFTQTEEEEPVISEVPEAMKEKEVKEVKVEEKINQKQEEKQSKKDDGSIESVDINEDVESIIQYNGDEEKDELGSLNEGKESQNALKMNLVIFLAFLLAIIAWIFWVNRELIKERRENSEENKE
jgi:hypothetical protein